MADLDRKMIVLKIEPVAVPEPVEG